MRAFDREHALKLIHADVNRPIRETFEFVLLFGQAALHALDVPADQAVAITPDVRGRGSSLIARSTRKRP